MVRVAFMNSFMTLLFALNWQGNNKFPSGYSGYGVFLLCYYVYKRYVSVSGEASGIIYESEYWRTAELRIHH